MSYFEERKAEQEAREMSRNNAMKKIRNLAIGAVAGLLSIIVGLNSYTIVGVGKEKVGAFMGEVYSKPLTSGFHLVNPLADFERYDLQLVTHTFDNVGVPAQDNLKTHLDVSVTGQFIAGKTVDARRDTGSAAGFMRTHFDRRVLATVVEVGKETAVNSQDFYGKDTLARMEVEIVSRLNKELNPLGYNVTAVKFSDINLPQVVTHAVVKTKQRQQEIAEQQAKLEIAEKKAQEAVKTADATRDAADSLAQAKRTQADAEAYRIKTEAAAQAEANRKLASSATRNLIELKKAERWNGVLPTTVLGEGTNVMMGMK